MKQARRRARMLAKAQYSSGEIEAQQGRIYKEIDGRESVKRGLLRMISRTVFWWKMMKSEARKKLFN